MVPEINKIHVKSSVNIIKNAMPTLCFVDGKLIDDNYFSMVNHEVNLYKETLDYLTVSYSENDAKIFYFNVVLKDYGTIIEKYDTNTNWLQGLKFGQFLVFVDGRLLEEDEYEFLSSDAIALKLRYNDEKFHSVIIYVADYKIEKEVFITRSGETIKFNYNRDRHLIFKNGYLIANNRIYTDSRYQSISINDDIQRDDIIRCVTFSPKNQTLNFKTEKGFLIYGPEDDYKKDVPLYSDHLLSFNTKIINLVDDIRTGFILRSDRTDAEYLVVDDDFNKSTIKVLNLQNPVRTRYDADEYYFLVPECKKITDYLSKFDQNGTIIPEVLEIFQRFLLDEFQDSIERLRNIRNVNKIDSVHIDKLLNMLGSKFDLRNKTLEQKRELLEELSSLYRIKGTEDYYNIFNVTDSDIGLATMEQLFTIRNNAAPKKEQSVSTITTSVNQEGLNYVTGKEYYLSLHGKRTDVKAKVINTDDNGRVKSVAAQIGETVGTIDLTSDFYDLVSVGDNARFDIKSTPSLYEYVLRQEGAESVLPLGQSFICQADGYPGNIVLTNKNGNIEIKPSIKTGNKEIKLDGVPLRATSDNIVATITSHTQRTDEVVFENSTPSGDGYSVMLEPGIYYYEMSGGGGAGGAADSTVGNTADIGAGDGSNGEFIMGQFTISKRSNITVYVGGGGTSSYARGHGEPSTGAGGAGYADGVESLAAERGETDRPSNTSKITNKKVQKASAAIGFLATGGLSSWSILNGAIGSLFGGLFKKHVTIWDCVASGAAGGASAILINNELHKKARGGNGGYAKADHNDSSLIYPGGLAGGRDKDDTVGYFNRQSGGALGGHRNYDDNTFTSQAGENGWVKIYRGKVTYSLVLDDIRKDNVTIHSKFKTSDFNIDLPSIAEVTYEGDTLSNVVIEKPVFEAKLNPITDGTFTFEFDMDWVYEGTHISDLSEYGITYDGIPNAGNKIIVSYTAATPEFILEVTGYDEERGIITSYDYTPKEGYVHYSYKDGKIVENANPPGDAIQSVMTKISEDIKLYVDSPVDQIKEYEYNLSLNDRINGELSPSRNYTVGDELTLISNDPELKKFRITVEEVDAGGSITQFRFVPTHSDADNPQPITGDNVETTKNDGNGAVIDVTVATQPLAETNTLKEYVDFFNKEDLGAVHKVEYRFPYTDYGLVSEGTEHSPYPWILGAPDQDYGRTYNDISPEGRPIVVQDKDYGRVTDEIKGKWYQWWEWDRDPNYYPTNHIELTITAKNNGELSDILERFFSQFYKIASTVLYIHRIITNYKFGNDSSFSKNEDGSINGAIVYGFLTGAPIACEKYFFTSDPDRQAIITTQE